MSIDSRPGPQAMMASAIAAHVIWIGQPSGTVSSTMQVIALEINGRGALAGRARAGGAKNSDPVKSAPNQFSSGERIV
jgi:hypothetical protein